ncbi:MAG: archaeosortase A [Thermoplasmatota archaeon]
MHKDTWYVVALLGGAAAALLLGHLLFEAVWYPSPETFEAVVALPLFAGLLLLGAGFFLRCHVRHLVTMSGWLVFGGYWATQPGYLYVKEAGDVVNASLCIAGVFFLFYLGYHEYLSHRRSENVPALSFIAGATFISGFFYFLIDRLQELSGLLIKVVADQTVWVTRQLGYDVVAGSVQYGESASVPVFFNGWPSVDIILACTGLQSIMIFVGVIAALRGVDRNRRLKAFAATVPVIYVLNVIRNVGVILGVEVLGASFYMMHNVVGKAGSLVALIVLAYVAFELLPELYDNIMDLFDLPKRRGPVERALQRLRRR